MMETRTEAVKEKVVGQTKKEEEQEQRNMDRVTQKPTGREGQEQWDWNRNRETGRGGQGGGQKHKHGDRDWGQGKVQTDFDRGTRTDIGKWTEEKEQWDRNKEPET